MLRAELVLLHVDLVVAAFDATQSSGLPALHASHSKARPGGWPQKKVQGNVRRGITSGGRRICRCRGAFAPGGLWLLGRVSVFAGSAGVDGAACLGAWWWRRLRFALGPSACRCEELRGIRERLLYLVVAHSIPWRCLESQRRHMPMRSEGDQESGLPSSRQERMMRGFPQPPQISRRCWVELPCLSVWMSSSERVMFGPCVFQVGWLVGCCWRHPARKRLQVNAGRVPSAVC